jgi:O-methyltransferase
VSIDEVRSAFQKYGLLDDQVRFLKGWFKDTLPAAPIKQLAVVRLDGDMYESTMDGLVHLYPKLSPGGFLIVDDYGVVDSCRRAVEDYRRKHGIADPIMEIDGTGVYWQRS